MLDNPILALVRRCRRITELKALIAAKEDQARIGLLHAERIHTQVYRDRAVKVARNNQADADRYKRELEALRKGATVDVRA